MRPPSTDVLPVKRFWKSLGAMLLVTALISAIASLPARAQEADDTASTAIHGTPAEAAAVVATLQDSLLRFMTAAARSDAALTADEIAALHEAVARSHDFDYISRIVLGRLWRNLDEEDRARFTEKFTRLSLATYSDRFADFEGQSFTVTGEGEGSFGQRRISAELRTGDKQHAFDYLLRNEGETWRIVNIIVDGVSDLALKRAEYAAFASDNGFEALLDELDRQHAALLADADR